MEVLEIVFIPSFEVNAVDGFSALIESLVGDVYRQASFIPRIATHTGVASYQVGGRIIDGGLASPANR